MSYEDNHPFYDDAGHRWCTVYGGLIPPGKLCAHCAPPPVDASEQFGVQDSLSLDTGGLRKGFTEQEIIDRAERTAARWRWYWRVWWCFPAAIVLVFALYEPVHTWLHNRLELLLGFFLGSTAEAIVWGICSARQIVKTRAAFEALHQRYAGDATLTAQEVRGVLHELQQRAFTK